MEADCRSFTRSTGPHADSGRDGASDPAAVAFNLSGGPRLLHLGTLDTASMSLEWGDSRISGEPKDDREPKASPHCGRSSCSEKGTRRQATENVRGGTCSRMTQPLRFRTENGNQAGCSARASWSARVRSRFSPERDGTSRKIAQPPAHSHGQRETPSAGR